MKRCGSGEVSNIPTYMRGAGPSELHSVLASPIAAVRPPCSWRNRIRQQFKVFGLTLFMPRRMILLQESGWGGENILQDDVTDYIDSIALQLAPPRDGRSMRMVATYESGSWRVKRRMMRCILARPHLHNRHGCRPLYCLLREGSQAAGNRAERRL